MPLIYTKSWEDAEVDMLALKEVLRNFRQKKPRLLVIASAGDTALSLLSNKVKSITCVDIYNSQLCMTELKALLCQYVQSVKDRIKFLEGTMRSEKVYFIYELLRRDLVSKHFWDHNIDIIVEGVHNIDSFDLLFNKLYKSNNNYRKSFSNRNIMKYIGEDDVKYCLKKRYADHIREVMIKHERSGEENYFYYQMLYQKYPKDNYPPYLYNREIYADKLELINSSMEEYLLTTNKIFEFVHTSNITDYMNLSQLRSFLILLNFRMKKRGRVVFRRLNGDIELRPYVNKQFIILELDRDFVDKSYLYQEVIVATPRKD